MPAKPKKKAKPAKPEKAGKTAKPAKSRTWLWVLLAFFLGLPLVAAALFVLVWTSDNNSYLQGMKNISDSDLAVEYLSKVDNPNSAYYCEAKFNLGELLYEKGRYEEAAEAYNAAIESGNWEDYVSYSTVAMALRYGTREKALPVDMKRAADLYAASHDPYDHYSAAIIYYELKAYDDARRLFEELGGNPAARGYLGLMHLYGFGGLKPDAKAAWNCLKDSADMPEFAVAKGDLALYLGNGSRGRLNLEEALSYYRQALKTYSSRKDVRYRCEAIENVLASEQKYKAATGKRGRIYWDSYRWNGGTYTGEVTNVGYGYRESYGWGWFVGDGGSLAMGRYYYQTNNGPGLIFIPVGNSFEVKTGKFDKDVLVDGFIIRGADMENIDL